MKLIELEFSGVWWRKRVGGLWASGPSARPHFIPSIIIDFITGSLLYSFINERRRANAINYILFLFKQNNSGGMRWELLMSWLAEKTYNPLLRNLKSFTFQWRRQSTNHHQLHLIHQPFKLKKFNFHDWFHGFCWFMIEEMD